MVGEAAIELKQNPDNIEEMSDEAKLRKQCLFDIRI